MRDATAGDLNKSHPDFNYLDAGVRASPLYADRLVFRQRDVIAGDGVPLVALEAGDRRHPGILIVNALGVSALFLAPLVRILSARHHVVTWESRGLPDDRAVGDDVDLSVARHAQDAADVLAASPGRLAAVVSFCSGVNVAAAALAGGLVDAARWIVISPSMVLEKAEDCGAETDGSGGGETQYQRTMLPLWRTVSRQGPRYAALVRTLLQQGRRPAADDPDAPLQALNDLPFQSDHATHRYARLQAACLDISWRPVLARLHLPTLVLHALADDLIHPDSAAAVAAAVPGALLQIVEGGHYAIHGSASLHRAVRSFLPDDA